MSTDNANNNRGRLIKWLAIVLIAAGVVVTAVDVWWMYRHGYSSDKTRASIFRGVMIALLLAVVVAGRKRKRELPPRDGSRRIRPAREIGNDDDKR